MDTDIKSIRVGNVARIATATNQKGGSGKTTTTANMGFFFASLGYKVLLIDGDAQASLSKIFLKGSLEKLPASLTTLIRAALDPDRAPGQILPTADAIINLRPGLDLLPATRGLTQCQTEISNRAALWVLEDIITPIRDQYDLILIDTVPNLGHLQGMALRITNDVLIPVQATVMDIQGLNELLQTLTWAKRENPTIRLLGIVLNDLERNTNLTKEVRAILAKNQLTVLGEIPHATDIAAAPGYKQTIFEYKPSHPANTQYRILGHRMIEAWTKDPALTATDEVSHAS